MSQRPPGMPYGLRPDSNSRRASGPPGAAHLAPPPSHHRVLPPPQPRVSSSPQARGTPLPQSRGPPLPPQARGPPLLQTPQTTAPSNVQAHRKSSNGISASVGGGLSRAKQEAVATPPPSVNKTAIQRVQNSFESGKYSDLTVVCGTRRWKVHKFQLCQGSEVFEAMLKGYFMEAAEKEITLPEDDESAINHVLRYMYHLKYRPSSDEDNQLVLHMRVAKAADKYKMPELCKAAEMLFRIDIVNNAHLPSFVSAVQEAYNDDGYDIFRKALVKSTVVHLSNMRADRAKYKSLWDIVDTVALFSGDVLRAPPASPAATFQEVLDSAAANKASPEPSPNLWGLHEKQFQQQWSLKEQ